MLEMGHGAVRCGAVRCAQWRAVPIALLQGGPKNLSRSSALAPRRGLRVFPDVLHGIRWSGRIEILPKEDVEVRRFMGISFFEG